MDSEWFSYNTLDYGVNTSRSKDTENYLLVESGQGLETAVGITVASDKDTFVDEHDNNTHTRLFPVFLSIYICLNSSLRASARIAISK